MRGVLSVHRWRWRVATMGGVVVAAVGLAGCGGERTASAGIGGRAAESFQGVPGSPFGVVATRDGRYAFVDLVVHPFGGTTGGRVLVYSVTGFVPRLIRTIQVPGEAVGCSLTRDGRLLLVANAQGATVVSVARAEHGAPHPVLGTLSPPRSAHLQAAGAIETASSANGRYMFVSLEYGTPGGVIAVYDLGAAPTPRFGPGDYVGAITLGGAVVGSALSPDGRYLYVTSEIGGPPHAGSPDALGQDGTLSVISVAAAEHDPAHAVLAAVPALRQPVRVAVSPDGSVAWVTARASDRLLGFSTARLLSDPAGAMLADVKVGTAPVGVAVFDHGDRVVVADSDRFNRTGAHAALTIVNTRAALTHQPAVAATLRAGQFPRELAVERDNTVVLVSNFASDQLQAVNISRLR